LDKTASTSILRLAWQAAGAGYCSHISFSREHFRELEKRQEELYLYQKM
jgi:hypothetical protein